MARYSPQSVTRRVVARCDYDLQALLTETDSAKVPLPKLPTYAKATIIGYCVGLFACFGLVAVALLQMALGSDSVFWGTTALLGLIASLVLLSFAYGFIRPLRDLADMGTLFTPGIAATLDSFEEEFALMDKPDTHPLLKQALAEVQLPVAVQLVALLRLQAEDQGEALNQSVPARELERLLADTRSLRYSL